MITCNYLLAVSIRQKQLLRHEEEDGEDMEVEEDKIGGKVGRGQKVEGVEMTEGGGQRGGSVGKGGVVGGQRWRWRRRTGGQRGGAEDRQHSVDMCFCQTGSSSCCLLFQLLSIRECQ